MAAPLTIGRLLAERWFTRTAQWAAVADFTVDGRRLGAEPYQLASRSRHETRLEQKQSETFLAAHALAHLGYRDVVTGDARVTRLPRDVPDQRRAATWADRHRACGAGRAGLGAVA